MAQQVEPMDIDSDFDNKENSLHHNNVLPFTEKGYDELDVSELNMKLRYSVTPASSPMSKSCTARSLESGDDSLNITVNENLNLTRSLNSTMTKSDNILKSLKVFPLKAIHTEQFVDSNRSTSVLRPLESTVPPDNTNVTVTISTPSDIDENLSLPSSSSSTLHTPEATTPTKDIPPKDGGSPIMRGLKSVFSIFRSSQSPIPPAENECTLKPQVLCPVDGQESIQGEPQAVLASTPIAEHRRKEMSPTKRSSPKKDSSIVFNQDLEKELQWKDETTIIFSQERIPIHKLMFQQQRGNKNINQEDTEVVNEDISDLNSTVTEYMDISNTSIKDITTPDIQTDVKHADSTLAGESDNEFVDCETTFTKNEDDAVKNSDSILLGDTFQDLNITQVIASTNDSGSRLKQIILDTTQDILDATLSVKPEDLLPDVLDQTKVIHSTVDINKTIEMSKDINESSISQCDKVASVESLKEDLNATKVLHESSVIEPAGQTLDTTQISNKCTQNTSFNDTKSEESVLDVTLQQEKVADNLSTIIINEVISQNNKPLQDPVVAIVDCLDSNIDIELNKSKLEPSVSELPVNIPLPDEDDLDKDLILPADIAEQGISGNLPLELVNDMKVISEGAELFNNVYPENTNLMLSENINKYEETISDTEHPDAIVTSSDNVAEPYNVVNVDRNNHDSQSPIKAEEFDKCDKVTDVNLDANISTTDNGINIVKEIGVNIVHETAQSTADNENACKPIALPDIVNQTITMSDADNKEAITVSKSANLPEEIDNTLNKTINLEPCAINTIEAQIMSEYNSQQINVDNKEMNTCNDSYTTCTIDNNITMTDSSTNPIEFVETKVIDAHSQTSVENITSPVELQDAVDVTTKAVEEEVMLSGHNSPFTLVVATEKSCEGQTEFINNEDSFGNNTKLILTPSNSPPITSKGYNFNFDDLDFDPFATKMNIRMSPPFDSPKDSVESRIQAKSVEKSIPNKDNRRKTQCDGKRPTAPKKLNSTFHSVMSDNTVDTCSADTKLDTGPSVNNQMNSPDTIGLNPNNLIIDKTLLTSVEPKTEEKLENELDSVIKTDLTLKEMEQMTSTNCNEASIESNFELKATSSSEQSTYCSASDSSVPSRNVFNLPEIDDINFNPFATKSKMRQSPPPSLNLNSSPISPVNSQTEDNASASEDKIENELMEKNASGGDLSSTTTSSKVTDERNVTSKEIHTEDEDTIEGPFLEAEDLSPEDKMSDFDDDNIDMMQFNELPTQNHEENLDNGEMFIDAEAFEFLLNQNKTNTIVDSGKESLFLKFDPLFAKRMSAITSDGVVASLAKLQNRQSTPTKVEQGLPKNMPVAGPSKLNETQDMDITNSEESMDDINITISKPMMVVPPAVNPVTPRNKSITPNRSNRRSITFTSPAMAVIDRLLSLSGNTSALYDTTVTQVSREQNEADIALSQLRELLAEKEINVYNLRTESNELRDRLNTLESHVSSLETESRDRLKKINDLNETLAEKTKMNRSMAAVVEEYERTIASLISETAQDRKRHAEERIKLINERDEQTAHLSSMEVSFSDLHSKYEKSKQIIINCKANEDKYKKSIKEFEENFAKLQNNYELLKQHATSKLNHANQEMEKINRTHEAEVLKLNAMIKRKDLHITSLEESLIQKTKANEELTAICDELINKVG